MGQINGVFSYFRDNLWRFLGSGWYWRWYSVVIFGLFGSFLRIGRNTSGRRWSSGDGYSLELFGRDSISFVIQNGQIVDGSSVGESFAEVDGEVIEERES